MPQEITVQKLLPKTVWRIGNNLTPDGGNFVTSNGQNGMFRIWAWTGIAHPVATMAQERAEWGWKHKLAFILWLPLAATAAALTMLVDILFAPLGLLSYMVAYSIVNHLPALKRRMEYFGHAVSIEVAVDRYSMTRQELEDLHVRSLTKGGYSFFKGVSAVDALIGLRDAAPAAKKWVRDMDPVIRRYQADVSRLNARA